MSCPWCEDGVCRNKNRDGEPYEEKCDFKTLPATKEAIVERLTKEYKECDDLLNGAMEDSDDVIQFRYDAYLFRDKLKGIQIMTEKLVQLGGSFDVPSEYKFGWQKKLFKIKLREAKFKRAGK